MVNGHHCFRSAVEIARARIIAEPLPGVQDVGLGRRRQAFEVGKPPEPLTIIWQDSCDLRLLEHDLGNKNGVRIARLTPWKIATVDAKPFQEAAPKGWSGEAKVRADNKT